MDSAGHNRLAFLPSGRGRASGHGPQTNIDRNPRQLRGKDEASSTVPGFFFKIPHSK